MSNISDKPIDLAVLFSNMHDPRSGAVVLFSGESRNHHHGKAVDFLEYESYDKLANRLIQNIVDEAILKWKLHKAICIHRVGRVNISESAVVIITCSSHRAEAYSSNRFIIDRVKSEVPIWKKEYYSDGTFAWGRNDC